MSTVVEMMEIDLSDIFETEGVAATFAPAIGAHIACNIIIDYNYTAQPAGSGVNIHQQGKIINVRVSQIGRAPVRGEKFITEAATYTVQNVWLDNDGLTARVVVT